MAMNGRRFTYHIIPALAALLCAYIVIYGAVGQGIFSHSTYDSYTRQALAWWSGSTALPENISWLELACYNGQYYVSFPPFPSVVMAILTPFFGLNTPDNFVNTLFGIGTMVLIYRYLIRRETGGLYAALIALLMTLGSNLLYLSATGWVWFAAQTQGFFFSVLALYLMQSDKKAAWAFSFLSLGIAMACRPFQVIYAPILVYELYHKLTSKGAVRKLLGCVPYAAPLLCVGLAMRA
jgi:4-amino-4-deoxy-L-arabinose transferase-like glycosyltransferase